MSSASEAKEPLIVLPGPWPGHPHPFKHVRVYDDGPHPAYHTCSDCPKNMLCLAGKKLFEDKDLQGRARQGETDYYTRYTICDKCFALIWFEPWYGRGEHEDTLHICYCLGKGLWARLKNALFPSAEREALGLILMAAIDKADPDLVPRFFRKDNLCRHYKGIVGDCARLYMRFLRQRAYLPDEIRAKGWTKLG
jgi:hypothetical protein